MSNRKDKILEKETFLQGIRQKWTGIFLLYSFIIMTIQVMYGIDPSTYMNFAITIGSLFILGGSVDSYIKINATKSLKEKESNEKDIEPPQNS